MKQPGADLLLQPGNGFTQCRLAASDAVRGAVQLAKLGCGDEIAQVSHVHSDDFLLSIGNQKRLEFIFGLVKIDRVPVLGFGIVRGSV
jgi:hypothetical protein